MKNSIKSEQMLNVFSNIYMKARGMQRQQEASVYGEPK